MSTTAFDTGNNGSSSLSYLGEDTTPADSYWNSSELSTVSEDDAGWGDSHTGGASQHMAEILVFSIIWIMSVAGNILVCIVIFRSRRLQSTTNYFVVSLALGDLLFTFLCMPFILGDVVAHRWVFGRLLCKVVRFVQFLVPACMLFVFVSICADRFYTIIYPLSFKVTRHRAKQLIFVSWVAAMLLASPCFYFFDTETITGGYEACNPFIATGTWSGIAYMSVITAVEYVLPVIMLAVGYTRIFKFIWRSGVGGRTFQRTINSVPRPKVKIVKMIMVVNGVSFALTLPLLAASLWYCSRDPEVFDHYELYTAVVWTYFSSAVAKPGIYSCYNSNFRRGCKEVFCMSNMKCYRSNAYTITTASKFSKKNYVGAIDGLPSRDYRRVDSPTKTFDRSTMLDKYTWPLGGGMPSTYL